MREKYTAISLFCGVGGIDLGFKSAGVNVIWANDSDKNACITYRENFKNILIEKNIEDIRTDEIPYADIILFGFPCTSFSIAGYRKGFNDVKTGHLFFEALRIIKEKQPKVFFIENVKNLLFHDNGETFMIIKNSLEEAGYYLKYQVLNAKDYGNIPQNRERIFVVGFKNKENYDKFCFPEPIKLTRTISDITKPDEIKEKKYYYENSKYYPILKERIKRKDTIYQFRRSYVRENKSNLCPTLVASMGTGGHNVPLLIDKYGIRKLTPRECFSFQGFPENYKLPDIANYHLYKQVGNSVVVPVVERIAKCIVNALTQ
ncbi:DNA cytosine methyltransferase [Senegalia massiliensis]|uniref:Cytosine-specific methyltransferase n=1 Tax=Senegalia massiliensis TaxID=1720316 RepID=A0A845QV34_9CLOT|nr:DNA cytosine methyltransferase [Senegalia massiliensis]NBI06101.1 DNA cytosine methyltransferase [Senegalia massiliensis]